MPDESLSSLQRAVWELQQRVQITETLINYCVHVDRNDPVALTELVFGARELAKNVRQNAGRV